MLTLSTEIQMFIFSNTCVIDLKNLASTCQWFNEVIHHSGNASNHIKRSALLNTDLKIINLNVIIDLVSLLSSLDMAQLDFSYLTLEKLWKISETDKTILSLRKLKLFAALHEYKAHHTKTHLDWGHRAFSNLGAGSKELKLCEEQTSYQYLIALSTDAEIEKQIQAIYNKRRSSMAPLSTKKLESIYQGIRNSRKKRFNLTVTEIAMNYTFLKIHNCAAVNEVFSALWQNYVPTHFFIDGQKTVLAEVFEGLCRVIKENPKKTLGYWSNLILEEEQTQSLLKILPNRIIDNLTLIFTKVTAETLQKLAGILSSEPFISNNRNSNINLSLHIKKSFMENSSKENEEKAQEIFKDLEKKFSSLNLPWKANISHEI